MWNYIMDILFGKETLYYDPRIRPEWAKGLYSVDIYKCRRKGHFSRRVAVTPPTDDYSEAMYFAKMYVKARWRI